MLEEKAVFMLKFIADEAPESVLSNYHQFVISKLANNTVNFHQTGTISQIGATLVCHLVGKHPAHVCQTILDLLDKYLDTAKTGTNIPRADMDAPDRFFILYMMAMTHWFPPTVNVCWQGIVKKLFHDHRLSSIINFERQTGFSLMWAADGQLVGISNLLDEWLRSTVFALESPFLAHTIDLAILLDMVMFDDPNSSALAQSWLDKAMVHIEKSQPASITLVEDWITPICNNSVLMASTRLDLPKNILQHVVHLGGAADPAVALFIKLISCLDYTRKDDQVYSLLEQVLATAQSHWPHFLDITLEQAFSKAMSMNISSDSDASLVVERILGNVARLFDANDHRQGSENFSVYMSTHWSQVMLLFLNHPSSECRGVGYQLLANSCFWQQPTVLPPKEILCKVLIDNWFRLLRNRYLSNNHDIQHDSAITQLRHLVINCLMFETLKSQIVSALLDGILNGSLEKIPRANITNDTSMLLERASQMSLSGLSVLSSVEEDMPRYIPHLQVLGSDIKAQDKIYMDNIQLTIGIFKSALEAGIGQHLLGQLARRLPTTDQTSIQVYDQALPQHIPYPHDINNGCAFKDHPALFALMDVCSPLAPDQCLAIIRSVLIYFIAFWNMDSVVASPTALAFATQLQETCLLWLWMRPNMPSSMHSLDDLFPFLSSQELGQVLYRVMWPLVRNCYKNPTEQWTTPSTETEALLGKVKEICHARLSALERSPTWQAALKEVVISLGIIVP
ncbi:hypothetical protein DM01DRAFT_1125400 [Hesseltinella vesiculosa]|uniref:Uncharacterized protein n=1 Tax=Hesseltinella vesiculosa TaxID=101127 RepID=A0A1X2GU74_9FUNG|nr:hypothetical protein DM01DRAFT_1125400 [Hesseltinella vesiculosa]